jgi:hypothetical protein
MKNQSAFVISEIQKKLTQARLIFNSELVGSGPARGVQQNGPFDKVNVHSWLKKEKNLIAVRA